MVQAASSYWSNGSIITTNKACFGTGKEIKGADISCNLVDDIEYDDDDDIIIIIIIITVHRADNPAAICEPTVYTMWDP
jgi:hypothetical protein